MVSFGINRSALCTVDIVLDEEKRRDLNKKLYEHLRIYERLDIMDMFEILTEVEPKCNPYNHYILEKVKDWNGDVTIDVFNMMLNRLNIFTVEESKEYCRKICLVGCRLVGERLGLEPSKGRVDLHHELSRHRLSTKSYYINDKYEYHYRGDRSFNSFVFSITLSAKTDDEKRYAEEILCRYVTGKLSDMGFKGFSISMKMFEWKEGESVDIELPSCIRFTDKFLSKLDSSKRHYIKLIGNAM
uniref:Uncharacterized protein n=1 Tax=Pithovirus LCPAC406 TaxID=2506599 RepID=A0A481ZDH8_9VIRU|nr:MAG: uncharacterized protein LCPAC406_01510 [Pithovirus LCPAC406]